MPAPLASFDDLTVRLPSGTITDEDRAEALLASASAVVRNYTGQDFTADTTTDRVKVRKGRVRLPQRPVSDVVSVADVNGNAITDYELVNDVLIVSSSVPDTWAWEPRRFSLDFVDVEYTHGYDTIPDDIIAVVCQIAARAYGTPATDAGVQSESVSGYSYAIGAAAAAGPTGLLSDERAVLDAYRRVGGLAYFSP